MIKNAGGRHVSRSSPPPQALAAARAYWGDPDLTPETVGELLGVRAVGASRRAARRVSLARLRAQRFNALRQLIAAGPDYQTC